MITHGAHTDIGRVRESNEDALLVHPELGLYAVADGMGGYEAGEVASRLAIETVAQTLAAETEGDAETRLCAAIQRAHEAVAAVAIESGTEMGTTIVATLVTEDSATVAHVGDSRAYLVSDAAAWPVTSDHTVVNALIREGLLTLEQAAHHPQRHVLTQALGTSEAIAVETITLTIPAGGALVLCSDGLSNHVSQQDLLRIVKYTPDPQEAAERLVALANRSGGSDNITVVVIRRSPQSRDPESRDR